MVDFPSQQAASPWRREVEQDSNANVNIMATERTPLISRASDGPEQPDQSQPHAETSAAASLHGLQSKSGPQRYRWPSLVALLILCIVAVFIIVFAFIAPSAVEQYAAAAVVFTPTSLSIDSFTSSGVRARVQGNVELDASRVKSAGVRNLGRFCTWIATEAETGESEVQVSLPEYGNVLLGTAQIPGVKVYIRNGHTTAVDFLTDLQPGNVEGIRRIANDFIDGRLGQLRVVGKANVPVKSGLISLGKQFLEKEMVFANKDIPSLPAYDIKNLKFREIDLPRGKGMAADVSLKVENPYPISFTVPPLGFRILVDNCEESDPLIQVAHALTQDIDISPSHSVNINVTGTVRQLPTPLTKSCPGSTNSPLDNIVETYLHNRSTTIYVRGSDSPSADTPKWITDLISKITIPVPVPGKEMPGHLIKNFSLEDTHFSLPDPWAKPGSPKSNPRITANVRALIALPEELESVPLNVSRVRADADVYYKKRKMGRLDLNKWQKATSIRVEGKQDEMEVQAKVKNVPLEIQNQDVFQEVVEELIFGNGVVLEIRAKVDVGVAVGVLGEVVVRGVEAEGRVPVKRT